MKKKMKNQGEFRIKKDTTEMKIDSYLDHIYQRTFFQMARKKKIPPVFNNRQLKAAAS